MHQLTRSGKGTDPALRGLLNVTAQSRSLLGRYGLILIDPMHAGIRRVAAPVFAKAIEQNPELDAALVERSRALEVAGYHTQVQVSDETALVFLIDEKQRRVLRRTDAGYSDGGSSYSVPELLGRLKERPEDFSPSSTEIRRGLLQPSPRSASWLRVWQFSSSVSPLRRTLPRPAAICSCFTL